MEEDIFSELNIHLEGIWSDQNHELINQAVKLFFSLGSDPAVFWSGLANLVLSPAKIRYGGITRKGQICLNPIGLTGWTIVHELAHAWDFACGMQLSNDMRDFTQSYGTTLLFHWLWPDDERYWYRVGSPPPPCGIDRRFNAREDFAESVTAYVYPEEAACRAAQRGMPYSDFGFDDFKKTPRGRFVKSLLK